MRTTLVELIRQFRPTLILGHAPNDYHADHRAASELTDTCSWLCTSRGFVTATPVLKAVPAVWWMDTVGMHGFDPVIYIDISPHMPLKEQMLLCHDSQLRRSGDTTFAPLLDLMRLQARARGMQSGCEYAEVFRPHAAFKRIRAL
jgi:LmbE family N-acetylglucosaminyl deacetylase